MRLAPSLASILFCLAPCLCQVESPRGDLRSPGEHLRAAELAAESDVAGSADMRSPQDRKATSVALRSEVPPQPSPPPQEPDSAQPVPEQSTLLLVGTGLVGVALTSRWRRRREPPTTPA